MTSRSRLRWVGCFVMGAGLVGACGDDSETSTTSPTVGASNASVGGAGGAPPAAGGGGNAGGGGAGGSGAAGGGGQAGPPRLVAATYIGDAGAGNTGQNQSARNVLWSQSGDLVVSGLGGQGAPTTNGVFQTMYAGHNNNLGGDCWIGRLSTDLANLNAATLLGGSGDERPCYGLAELDSGALIVGGHTESSDGIGTAGTFQTNVPGTGTNGFAAQLSADLTTRLAGTYIGGNGDATMRGGFKVLSDGNVLAFGQANPTGLSTAGAWQPSPGGGAQEGWIGALTPDLTTLLWGTYLGSNSGVATEVVVGAHEMPDNDIVLFASSPSSTWLNGVRTGGAVPADNTNKAFVARLNPSGTQSMDWVTVLGPGEGNNVTGTSFQEAGMAVDGAGNIFVAGVTLSDMGTPGSLHATNLGGSDGFVCRVSSAGALAWCTHLGGAGDETSLAPVVGLSGSVLVTGSTTSTTFCDGATAVLDGNHSGGEDAYLAVLSADGGELSWCTFLGGSGDDLGRWLAVAADGRLAISGMTQSSDFPATDGAYDVAFNGGQEDMFVAVYENIPF